MNSSLIRAHVKHSRYVVKNYSFKASFFWFKIDWNEIQKRKRWFLGVDRFSLYSLRKHDHLDLGKKSLSENIECYLRQQNIFDKLENFVLYTNLAFLGHLFNPVSIIVCELDNDKKCAIIQIGNTFNQLKPYYVGSECFTETGFEFKTPKYFYISPFIQHDLDMTFRFFENEEQVNFSVKDEDKNQVYLTAIMRGEKRSLTGFNLFKETILCPFVSIKMLFLIHFHALILWIKKVPYYTKNEYKELQTGELQWNRSRPLRSLMAILRQVFIRN